LAQFARGLTLLIRGDSSTKGRAARAFMLFLTVCEVSLCCGSGYCLKDSAKGEVGSPIAAVIERRHGRNVSLDQETASDLSEIRQSNQWAMGNTVTGQRHPTGNLWGTAMSDETRIIEVSTFGAKVLVTFGDGKMAFLEDTQIRRLAVRLRALIPIPVDLRG
jgi:hypothetical protein